MPHPLARGRLVLHRRGDLVSLTMDPLSHHSPLSLVYHLSFHLRVLEGRPSFLERGRPVRALLRRLNQPPLSENPQHRDKAENHPL